MPDFLVYFHSYWDDPEAHHSPVLDWHSKAKNLYDGVAPGNCLWLVVASSMPGEWGLRSRFVIKSKRFLSHPATWGPFEFIGDGEQAQTFDIRNQEDFAPFLTSLEFKTGKSIKLTGSEIGLAIQSPRELSVSDCLRLNKYIGGLKRI